MRDAGASPEPHDRARALPAGGARAVAVGAAGPWGRGLVAGEDDRYEVALSARLVADPHALTDADFDTDHLEAVGAMLRAADDADDPTLCAPPPTRKAGKYDLCSRCYAKFARDPFGREVGQRPQFSKH